MRVFRSFAFLDLCGFTSFTCRHPADRVVLVLEIDHRVSTALPLLPIPKWSVRAWAAELGFCSDGCFEAWTERLA